MTARRKPLPDVLIRHSWKFQLPGSLLMSPVHFDSVLETKDVCICLVESSKSDICAKPPKSSCLEVINNCGVKNVNQAHDKSKEIIKNELIDVINDPSAVMAFKLSPRRRSDPPTKPLEQVA